MMAELTPDRLQELRRIAEAATPGTWASNMQYISTFDPPTVLALLDEIERLQVLAEVLKHVRTCDHCECALCPEGTGLSYRAYRAALGGALSGTTYDAER